MRSQTRRGEKYSVFLTCDDIEVVAFNEPSHFYMAEMEKERLDGGG